VNTSPEDGTMTVGIVQGSADARGLAALGGDSAGLRRHHIDRGEQLAGDIRAGRVAKPDVVIMPETFTDIRTDSVQDVEINQLVSDLGVPTLIGARMISADGVIQNVMIAWDPRTGPGQIYVKQQLVPFGEYVPLRSIARWFTPFVDNQVDLRPGTTPPVLPAAASQAGLAICFEIAYDYILTDAAKAGARFLAIPSNNVWFSDTEMPYQQLAMSKIRAVEHGRSVVVSATTGISAIILPDGTVTDRTELNSPAALVARVPLRATTTVSDHLGALPEWIMVFAGLVAFAAGIELRRRRRRPA